MIQKEKLVQFYFSQYRDSAMALKKKNNDGKKTYEQRIGRLITEMQRTKTGKLTQPHLEEYHRQIRNMAYYALKQKNQYAIMQIRDILMPELVRLDIGTLREEEQELVTSRLLEYLRTEAKFPIVLKADGLALGKGVLICNTLEEAEAGVKEIMEDKKFGSAGNQMVIEEFMTGREVSVLSFVDGDTIRIMTSSQDHKRALDGDQGLNTGGMGTFSPSPFYTKEVDEFCKKYIYQPSVDAMKKEGRIFKGIIFFGLMLTEDGPKVLEYNARFGDPETQVVLPRMKNDIVEVFEACIDGTLDQIQLEFEDNAAVCVVLASDGYPVKYEKGFKIHGLEKFKDTDGYYVFHAGTKFDEDGDIVTNGGRVLGVTAKGKDLKEARANAYKATEWINFANKYMRHDIGHAIDEA